MALTTGSLACLMLAALAACHSAHAQRSYAGSGFSFISNTDAAVPPHPSSAAVAGLRQAPAVDTTTCPAGIDPGNPEYAAGKGKDSQGVSYGIPMMQVDKLAGVVDKDNVLFCIVHFAADLTARDLPTDIKGCVPGTPRTPGGPPRQCYPYGNETMYLTGTAALSIIGAPDNKVGLLGLVPDARVYMYSVYPHGDWDSLSPLVFPNGTQVAAAWEDCEAELDARKTNRKPGTPDLKMVVFTDTDITSGIEAAGAVLKSQSRRRNDIMHVSAAWGTFNANGTWVDSYPAAFPEMVTISSVNKDFMSSQGTQPPVNFTDFSAPGEYIMWASALGIYDSELSAYGQRNNSIVVSPPLKDVQADLWNSPPPGTFVGSGVGSVTAGLVDCGLGNNGSCADAKGKICLMQRGAVWLAQKVVNCVAGGGIAAIIFNRDDQPPCERLVGSVLNSPFTGPLPGGTWPITLGASAQQGKALLAALKAGQVKTVTLNSPARGPFTEVPIQFSNFLDQGQNIFFAGVMGAGALGALWSAHPTCTATEILAAVSATAKPKQDPSLSPEEIKALYGKGLLQMGNAHNYLLANPCKPTPIITITTTLKSDKFHPTSEDNNADNVTASHFTPRGWFKVTVYVRDAVTGKQIPNVQVTLALNPNNLAECGATATTRTYRKKGGAVFSCSRAIRATGSLTITATSAPTALYGPATGSTTVNL